MNMIKFIVLMLLSQIAIAEDWISNKVFSVPVYELKEVDGIMKAVQLPTRANYTIETSAYTRAFKEKAICKCDIVIKISDVTIGDRPIKPASSSAQSSSRLSVTLTGGRPNLREDGSILLPEKILGYHFKVGPKSVILQTQPGETFSYEIAFYVGPTDEALIATITTDNPPLYSDYVPVRKINF